MWDVAGVSLEETETMAKSITAPIAHRFTIEDVDRMFEVGILNDDERVERASVSCRPRIVSDKPTV